MKKIFIILFYFIYCSKVISQPVQQRGTSSVTVQDARWMGQYNAFIPRYNDTTAANLQKGIDTSGAIVYCYNTKTIWYRQNSPKKWVNLGSGGVPIDTSLFVKYTDSTIKYVTPTQLINSLPNTIYTGDGTLSGDRTIDGDGYNLTFDNVNNFFINGSNFNSFYLNDDGSAEIIGQGVRIIGSNIGQYLKLNTNGSVDIKAYNNNVNITGDSIFLNGVQNNVGAKQLRYNPTTGLISYADTTGNPALTLQDVTDNGSTTTNDVDMANVNATSFNVTGTNGNGHIHLKHQSSDASGTGSSTTLFANSSGYLKWKNDGGYYSTLEMAQSADRNYRYQNKSYTLADSTTLADSVAALRTAVDSKGSGTVIGSGTTNELSYWSGANTLGSLSTATYPSLTELSYVKGVTSSIQTQLNTKGTFTLPSLTNRSVLFSDGTTITQDNSNFTYNSSTKRLTIGGATTSGELFRLAYSSSVYLGFNMLSTNEIRIFPGTASTSFYNITRIDGSTSIFDVDAVNYRIGINTVSPSYSLHVINPNTYGTGSLGLEGNGGIGGAVNFIKASGGATGDAIGIVSFRNNGTERARISSTQDDGTNDNGSIKFYTTATGGSITERGKFTTTGTFSVGTTIPASTALIDVASTTKGSLIPRMTTAQKNAISSPAEGLEVYDLTLHQKSYYNGTTWINY